MAGGMECGTIPLGRGFILALLCEAESVIKAVILYVRYRSDKWMKNMIEGM